MDDGWALRQVTGLPGIEVLADPERLARVDALAIEAPGSPLLPMLLRLAGEVASAEWAQLSLLADRQVATVVRCVEGGGSPGAQAISALTESLCTVTVLSGDVVVAADARLHPWLLDLPPVTTGAVVSYLGVPVRLADRTAVGALCVYGVEPREWTDRDVRLTCDVADVVALELQRLAGA